MLITATQDPNHSAYSTTDREPDESRMVKKFRRSAAGVDEQLPSDLRPPAVLKRTCDFLFNEIIGNAPELGNVHHFVWDRTRAIRNDFSIQQVSDVEDLRFAVDCFERIARFHIVSLHQLAVRETVSYKYDWQQDHEQLDRTLVSLMQLYDDSRGKIQLPNEAEFRAYLVVFQLKDPDLEDRVQTWPKEIIQDARVRKAMTLYAAAGNTTELQGPLKPPATQVIAQQDWQRFWNLIASTRTSYLVGCVAEISFNMIRKMALLGLLRAGSQKASGDFTVDEMCDVLALDSAEEAEDFCNRFNITFANSQDGQRLIDFSALRGRQYLPDPSPALQKQYKSEMVEEKRFGRTLPAVINGLSVKQAQEAGMINEDELAQDEEMDETDMNGDGHADEDVTNDEDSLFVPEEPKTSQTSGLFAPSAQSAPIFDFTKETKSIFDAPTEQQKSSPFSFGASTVKSTSPSNISPFAPPKVDAASAKPTFNFLSNATSGQSTSPKATPPPTFSGLAKPPGQQTLGTFRPSQGAASDEPKKENGTSLFAGFKPPGPIAYGETTEQNTSGLFSGFQLGKADNGGSTPASEAKKPLFAPPSKPDFTYKSPFLEDGSDSSAGSSPIKDTHEGSASEPSQKSPFIAPDASAKPTSTFTFGQPPNAAQPAPSPAPKHVTFETSTSTSPNATSNSGLNFPLSAQPATGTQSIQVPQPTKTPKQPTSFNFTPVSEPAKRRPSASDQFKPVKPSPLNQSFTSGVDTDQPVNAPAAASEAQKAGTQLFPGRQSTTTQSKPAPPSKPAPEPDFTSIINEIARELTLTPVAGLLDQYVDFIAGKVITDVQEKIYYEHVNAKADEFRSRVLSHRYGKFWRDLCRRKRFARQGRERRERTRRRLAQSKQEASETASLAGSVSFLGGSDAGSVQGSVRGGRQSRQEEVDKMFQQSMASGRWSKMARESEQARGGSKRPTSAHGMGPPQTNGHKRLKSTSHVDESGRVSKPASTNSSLQRSSYMDSFNNAPPRSTTKTNYFRLKAMGAQTTFADSSLVSSRKRQHSEMSGSPLAGSPPAASLNGSQRMSDQEPARTLVHSSPASSKSLRLNEEDDALLARVRALRNNLKEETSFFYAANTKKEQWKQSTSSQGSTYESPSLERARLDARWRASQSTTNLASPQADVPAYRLRESKFVPRENYGKVIPRSSKMREAQIADASVSVPESTKASVAQPKPSAAPSSKSTQPPPQATSTKPPLWVGAPAPQGTQTNVAFSAAAPTQWPNATPSQFPAFGAKNSGFSPTNASTQVFGSMQLPKDATNPAPEFGSTSGFGSNNALDSPFDLSTQVPSSFMKPATKPASPSGFQSAFGGQQSIQDHTIQPQEIPETLSASFGQPDMPAFQQNSYMSTQPDLLTMDGSAPTGFAQAGHAKRSRGTDLSNEFIDDEAEEEENDGGAGPGLGHTNPYAVLSNGNFQDEEEEVVEYDDDDFDQWNDNQYAQSRYADQRRHYPGSYQVDEYDEDGDIEDEDGEGYDEDDFEGGDTEEATEEDDYDDDDAPAQPAVAAASCTNTALAGKGQTETEAIELSD